MTGGMSVMSLFANPQTLDKCVLGLCTLHPVKPKSIAYLQCQIALHRKLLHKFRKWYKFSSQVKAQLHKKKLRKTGSDRIFHGLSCPFWTH